ncbi:MAG: ABC transporter ATP-binding protein [Thermoleophilia bacterium]
MADDLILRASGLVKRYPMGAVCVEALRGVDLELPRGGFLALMGPSGSGKSTLLNLLGSLDRPTEGSVWLDGRELTAVSAKELPDMRRRMIGFIFQGFNLIPSLTALENVLLPLRYEGIRGREARQRGTQMLTRMGLEDRLGHLPMELSGGEQQRVAIARALIMNPALILADEPTGELDSASSRRIMELLAELNSQGQSLIVVTHDPITASYARRVVTLSDGQVIEDRPQLEAPTETGPAAHDTSS